MQNVNNGSILSQISFNCGHFHLQCERNRIVMNLSPTMILCVSLYKKKICPRQLSQRQRGWSGDQEVMSLFQKGRQRVTIHSLSFFPRRTTYLILSAPAENKIEHTRELLSSFVSPLPDSCLYNHMSPQSLSIK